MNSPTWLDTPIRGLLRPVAIRRAVATPGRAAFGALNPAFDGPERIIHAEPRATS